MVPKAPYRSGSVNVRKRICQDDWLFAWHRIGLNDHLGRRHLTLERLASSSQCSLTAEPPCALFGDGIEEVLVDRAGCLLP